MKRGGSSSAATGSVVGGKAEGHEGRLKSIGGSASDQWNNILAHQAVQALWVGNSDVDIRDQQFNATIAALIGIKPRAELEG